MEKLIIIFILISTICLNAQTEFRENYRFKQDKKLHTGAGIGISAGAFLFVNSKTNDVNLAFNAAWMTAATAGLLKEGADLMSGREISIPDFAYTALSGLGTAFIMRTITKRRNKKQAKRDKLLRAFLADI